jgi:predicted porin
MRLSYISVAVLAALSVSAHAQSSVTLFGVVDAAVQYGTGNGVGSGNRTSLGSGAYNSTRIGFRGTEDLGGGMAASFWLEAGFSADDGQFQPTNNNNQNSGMGAATAGRQGLTFNRRSTVSLSGPWGEVRLGRDYTPGFWNLTVFDPFGSIGAGGSQTVVSSWPLYPGGVFGTGVRASNSVGYFLPAKLGGFYGQAMYFMGENSQNGAATQDDGRGAGLRVGYAAGPVNAAAAYQRIKIATGDMTSMNLGGQWDFGMAKLMAHVNRDRFDAPTSQTGKGWLIGTLVPVGAGEIRLAYSQYTLDTVAADPRSRKLALGYVHNLTKRTAVYTTVARVRNNGGAAVALNGATTAANSSSNGFDLGVRHSF